MEKLKKLKGRLKKMGSVLVAYSGGSDSTFLLKVACDVLGRQVLAVTATSATYPKAELAFAKKMARSFAVKQRVIKTQELKDKRFVANSLARCYFCKRELFRRLKNIAKKNKLNFVVDASNVSDKLDFRPGRRAKEELGVRSPLEEAGFTKEDIRRFSKKIGLITWDKPQLSCLASRIPYGTKINLKTLKQVEKAEDYLRNMGFQQVRVRHYNGLCRIEVFQKDIPALIHKGKVIVENLKRLGYNYVTVDLAGYRSGSLNPVRNIKAISIKSKISNGVNEVIKR